MYKNKNKSNSKKNNSPRKDFVFFIYEIYMNFVFCRTVKES